MEAAIARVPYIYSVHERSDCFRQPASSLQSPPSTLPPSFYSLQFPIQNDEIHSKLHLEFDTLAFGSRFAVSVAVNTMEQLKFDL